MLQPPCSNEGPGLCKFAPALCWILSLFLGSTVLVARICTTSLGGADLSRPYGETLRRSNFPCPRVSQFHLKTCTGNGLASPLQHKLGLCHVIYFQGQAKSFFSYALLNVRFIFYCMLFMFLISNDARVFCCLFILFSLFCTTDSKQETAVCCKQTPQHNQSLLLHLRSFHCHS